MWKRRRSHLTRLGTLSALLLCSLGPAGCLTKTEWERFWNRSDPGSQPEPTAQEASRSKTIRGTISPLVTIEGLRLTHVRGFGLVVDLVDTGGSDGPDVVKKYLLKEMRRRQDPSSAGVPAQEMLETRDTAMVEVTGLIPTGARKGDPFDVVIRALGSQTTSLVGGRLFLCDLKLYAETPSGVIGGKTLATASGPVFVSPFDQEGRPTEKVDLRTAWVLGGGRVKKSRRVRLVLNDPGYSIAQRIVTRLNGRYSSEDPVAVGQSPSFVDLHIPEKYGHQKRQFLERVVHTPLNAGESALRQRSEDLAKEIVGPGPDYESIAVAWEAIGPLCLPSVRPLYLHTSPAVRYYAGRSGLRLSDRAGMEVVAKFAKDAESSFRDEAIDELGFAVKMYAAGEHLRELLSESDVNVRIRAYKALRRRPHPAITSIVVDEDNLVLDIIESSGPYLIFVQRSLTPRIAVFGKQMRVRPPVIFPGERDDGRRRQLQISAREGDKELALIFRNKRTGRLSPRLTAPLNVTELIRFLGGTPIRGADGRMEGLGAHYSEIVDALSWFCESRSIPATFIAEDLTGKEKYDAEDRRERKESEY